MREREVRLKQGFAMLSLEVEVNGNRVAIAGVADAERIDAASGYLLPMYGYKDLPVPRTSELLPEALKRSPSRVETNGER